jgi:hypothetical protein
MDKSSIIERLNRYLPLVVIVSSSLIILFTRYFFGESVYLQIFDDDFFYYSETASNFHKYGFPTYDGIIATSGYHPLYFLLMLLITKLFSTQSIGFYLIVSLITFSSVQIVYFKSQRIINHIVNDKDYSRFGGAVLAFMFLIIAKGSMECIIAVPLMLFCINLYVSKDKYNLIAFIACLTILARLDSALFVIPLLISFFLVNKEKWNLKMIFIILISFTPLLLYLVVNYHYFNTLMPISGIAKQLKLAIGFDFKYIIKDYFDFTTNKIIFMYIPTILWFINLISLKGNTQSKNNVLLNIISVIFPLVFVFLQAYLSGWQFWAWYYYMLIPSSIVFLINSKQLRNTSHYIKYLILILIIVWSFVSITFKLTPRQAMFEVLNEINKSIKDKSGLLAMGDRAGLTSVILNRPILQLEGLMTNKEFIELLKKGNLEIILIKYNVKYYIAINPIYTENGWLCKEPSHKYDHIIKSTMLIRKKPILVSEKNGTRYTLFDLSK